MTTTHVHPIRTARLEAGDLSQQTVADAVGIDRSRLARYEGWHDRPPERVLRRLGKFFDRDPFSLAPRALYEPKDSPGHGCTRAGRAAARRKAERALWGRGR